MKILSSRRLSTNIEQKDFFPEPLLEWFNKSQLMSNVIHFDWEISEKFIERCSFLTNIHGRGFQRKLFLFIRRANSNEIIFDGKFVIFRRNSEWNSYIEKRTKGTREFSVNYFCITFGCWFSPSVILTWLRNNDSVKFGIIGQSLNLLGNDVAELLSDFWTVSDAQSNLMWVVGITAIDDL